MLRENHRIKQNEGEDHRRWFLDDFFDLVVWTDKPTRKAESAKITAFHLGFGKKYPKKIIAWNLVRGIQTGILNEGEDDPRKNLSPLIAKGDGVDYKNLLEEFLKRSPKLPEWLREDIMGRIMTSPGCRVGWRDLNLPDPRSTTVEKQKVFWRKLQARLSRKHQAGPKKLLPEEILKKVRLIEITMKKVATDLMGGQYRSHFRGHGMLFSEHRQYVAGDDVRHIDWKVTARARDPLIKQYQEERELTVLLVVDVSGSSAFGSGRKMKSELIAEIAGILGYAAERSGDKVGAVLFAGEVEKMLPPQKGRAHVLRMVSDILSHETHSMGTSLSKALETARQILKQSGVVVILSDFQCEDFKTELSHLAKRNDVIALEIRDPSETKVPPLGHVLVVDPESGREAMVDMSSYGFKHWMEQEKTKRQETLKQTLKSAGVGHVEIRTNEDYTQALVGFFRKRARRR